MIELCLFGAGRIGKVHAMALAQVPGVRIRYVVDAYAPNAEALAAEYGASVCPDAETALADDAVNGVIIASSTDTHADLLIQSARAGKAIFCEKPIDLDMARVRECVQVVEETGVLCALGFNRRFDPQFAKLQATVREGAVGNVEQVCITSRDPAPPPVEYIKVSGGLFRDMTIHDFDMARWLLGEEVVEVFATGSVLVDSAIAEAGDIDSALVTLKTASGKLAQISNSRRAVYGYDQRIEVFGDRGMVQAQNNTDTNLVVTDEQGERREKPQYFFLERYSDAYRLELMDFARCMLEGAQPVADHRDGMAALVLAEAALESYSSGRAVRLD